MSWKAQLDKAIDALKEVSESERIKQLTAKAKEAARQLAQKAKSGAFSAAEAFVEANADPSTLRVRYLNADLSILSPSDGIAVSHPTAGSLVINDGIGNAVVINAAADKAFVLEQVGTVKQLNVNTYDLGAEDGVNVVVFKD
jgi:hypothetical protein